jgi:2Fe-2S ferredoxin
MNYLSQPSDAEYDRMDEEEIEQGYRLGCQAIVRQNGEIKAINKPYF